MAVGGTTKSTPDRALQWGSLLMHGGLLKPKTTCTTTTATAPGVVSVQTQCRQERHFPWEARTAEAEIDAAPALAGLNEAGAAGEKEVLLVVGGQSAGLIRHIEPAGAIVRVPVAETREALAEAGEFQLSVNPSVPAVWGRLASVDTNDERDRLAARPLAQERSRLFDQQAEAYDRFRPTYPDAVIDELLGPVPAGLAVLDVGCGTGIASRQIAQRGANVLGVELAPRMAEIARGRGVDVEPRARPRAGGDRHHRHGRVAVGRDRSRARKSPARPTDRRARDGG